MNQQVPAGGIDNEWIDASVSDDNNPSAPSTPEPVTAVPADPVAAKAPPRSDPSRRGNGGVWLLALLALLGSLAALAAVGWQYRQADDQRNMAEFRLQSAIQDQAAQLQRLNERLAEQRADSRAYRREQQALVATLQADLRAQQQRLTEATQGDRTDWRLAELEYLLQLARQRLLLGRTGAGVIELLEAADQLAQEIDDPDLHEVRAALAVDLAELRALPSVDVEGIWLALEATAGQVARLRLVKPAELAEPAATGSTADSTAAAGWQARLEQGIEAALEQLSQLIQIRRRDEAYQPLLSPQYEGVLRQHLALLFEQAQLALLAGHDQLYRETLQDARQWVQRYFALDEAATAGVVDQIDALLQRTVTVDLPRTLDAHQAMRSFTRQRRDDASDPAATAPGPAAGGAGAAGASNAERARSAEGAANAAGEMEAQP